MIDGFERSVLFEVKQTNLFQVNLICINLLKFSSNKFKYRFDYCSLSNVAFAISSLVTVD